MTADGRDDTLPYEPIHRLIGPFERFTHVQAAAGVVLLACTAIALAFANSPSSDAYASFWGTQLRISLGDFEMHHSLKHWINDALMAVFFFVVGLEVKREVVLGELRDPRRAALPVVAALGGMLAPAAIYLGLQSGQAGARGWGVPMATDIAFVVGCLALLGPRVPTSLRVLLLSLAIADDIGAIVVIAVGYTTSIDLGALGLGLLGIAGVRALAVLGVRSLLVYTLAGGGIWLAFHESGIHATIAGVILGLLTPAHSYLSDSRVAGALERAAALFRGERSERGPALTDRMRVVRRAAREAVSPLEYLERVLHPYVGFLIMPLFALANAGVPIEMGSFGHPVALAVAAGLVIGKPLGILLLCWLAIRAGIAVMPPEVGWGMLAGAGALAGIGFTMALFIAGLALEGEILDAAKVGILAGSAVSALGGMTLLALHLPRRSP
jgi:NhaA family Na+:H+ antiporter